MKNILFLTWALLLSIVSFSKGHGGGHGGGHSHAAARHGGMAISSARGVNNKTTNIGIRNSRSIGTLNLSSNRTNAYRSYPVYRYNGVIVPGGHPAYYTYEYPGTYPYYYYGYEPFYYNPFYNPYLFNPYFGMFSVGGSFVYTPHYNYATPSNNNNGENNNSEAELEVMDGYAVYEHDTISGAVTLNSNAIFIENVDSGRNYDYKFRLNQKGLEFVSVYNTDSTQMCLTKVKDAPKKLWRIIHEGKLNVYDEHIGFIYRPEDVDKRSLMVVYNDEPILIGSSSTARTKLHLTEYINRVYGLDLNPNNFSWKELLIYLDKLD